VAGVLVYNRLQERATRRDTERAFGSRHADALLDEPGERREPTLEPLPQASEPVAPASPQADPRVDYVIELQGAVPRSAWAPLERRFGRRASLLDHAIALQLVSRNGVVSEAELLEFRSQAERIAAAQGARATAPPVNEALRAAQELDRACADVDVQIALHVLGPREQPPSGEAFGITRRPDGWTLLLDVPRTPDLARNYAAMADTARRLGGRVVDDNGNALDERALAAIGVEVEALRGRLEALGIEPGSGLALRLFS
jgi:hypothetical protein